MKIEFNKPSRSYVNVKDIPLGSAFQVDSCTSKQNLFVKLTNFLIVRLDVSDCWYGDSVQNLCWPDCVIVNAKVVVE